MITIQLYDKTVNTSYYRDPVIHNLVKDNKVVISIRKANIKNLDKNIDQHNSVKVIDPTKQDFESLINGINSNYPLNDNQ